MTTNSWTEAAIPDLSEHTAIVTGANSGIGLEGTRLLARNGAEVVMAVRSLDRGEAAAEQIRADSTGILSVRELDLASLESVATFAKSVKTDFDAIDSLYNNAGVMAIPRSETEDGFETQFGVNHLGHFALTAHLLPLLSASDGDSRVITQSSGLHENGDIDFDDLHHEDSYHKWDAYAQSKLANVLFAFELDRRLDSAGKDSVLSVATHPGYADTNLQKRGPAAAGSTLRLYLMKLANMVFAQPARAGAWPMLYAGTAPSITGGEYVGPTGLLNMRGTPGVQPASDRASDEELAERLWAVSEEMTGVEYDLG